ncbi:MAG: hypothetical protein RBR43_07775 [Desulfuromonadaceae bacterium]|jgi:tetratricopeptide (TPR) repeat protein|nr:hypothetical protein [Desulfuromonadaceae bacterium]
MKQLGLSRAKKLADQKKWPAAIKALQQYLAHSPDDCIGLSLLSVCLYNSGQHEAALLAGRKSLAIRPHHAHTLQLVGRVCLRLGNALALDYCRRAAELAPDDFDIQLQYAQSLIEQEHWPDFYRQVDKLRAMQPQHHTVQLFYFLQLTKQSRYPEAYAYAEEHAHIKSNAITSNNYGNVLMIEQGWEEALKYYRQGLKAHLATIPKQLDADAPAPKPQKYMDVGLARTALLAFHKDMAALKIPFFPCFGTLLGIVRDGELLPHDKDMDVGLPWATPRIALLEALQTRGYICPDFEKYQEKPDEYYATVIHVATRITIDFFFAKPLTLEDGSQVVEMGFGKAEGEGSFFHFKPFAMQPLNYAGTEFLAPANAAAHLEEVYGSNWHIPDANYDTLIRGCNLTPASRPVGLAMGYNRLLGHISEKNWKKAYGYCQQILMVQSEADPLIVDAQKRLAKLQVENNANHANDADNDSIETIKENHV